MAKPICVIYLPFNFELGNGRDNAPSELMKALNGNFGEPKSDSRIEYSDYWKDYYWFSFFKDGIDAPEFKVFHEKDFTDIQYQELKSMIETQLEEMKAPQI